MDQIVIINNHEYVEKNKVPKYKSRKSKSPKRLKDTDKKISKSEERLRDEYLRISKQFKLDNYRIKIVF